MEILLAVMIAASSSDIACYPTKALAHNLRTDGYRPMEIGKRDNIPYVIMENQHGNALIVVLPEKGMACPFSVKSA